MGPTTSLEEPAVLRSRPKWVYAILGGIFAGEAIRNLGFHGKVGVAKAKARNSYLLAYLLVKGRFSKTSDGTYVPLLANKFHSRRRWNRNYQLLHFCFIFSGPADQEGPASCAR
jgi:hypothetical protein